MGKTIIEKIISNHTHGVEGKDIKKNKYDVLSKMGALIEGPAFYEYLSARKNLEVFSSYSSVYDKKRIDELLDMLELTKRADNLVKEYSLGMKQRLGIAQALLNNPEILILDEPTNGLDPQGIVEIRNLV